MMRAVFTVILMYSVALIGCGGSTGFPTSPTSATPVTVSITISGNTTFAAINATSQLTATATTSDGSARDVTALCLWVLETWSEPVVALSSTGRVTTTAYGTARVNASYQGTTGSVFVTVRVTDVPARPSMPPTAAVGSWRNIHSPTGAVTRLDVRTDGDRYVVRAWGSCLPIDCDWGEVTTPVSDGEDGVLTLNWNTNQPLAKVMELRLLQDDRLESAMHNIGRTDYDTVQYMRKAG